LHDNTHFQHSSHRAAGMQRFLAFGGSEANLSDGGKRGPSKKMPQYVCCPFIS
jgi:hypothetical protein